MPMFRVGSQKSNLNQATDENSEQVFSETVPIKSPKITENNIPNTTQETLDQNAKENAPKSPSRLSKINTLASLTSAVDPLPPLASEIQSNADAKSNTKKPFLIRDIIPKLSKLRDQKPSFTNQNFTYIKPKENKFFQIDGIPQDQRAYGEQLFNSIDKNLQSSKLKMTSMQQFSKGDETTANLPTCDCDVCRRNKGLIKLPPPPESFPEHIPQKTPVPKTPIPKTPIPKTPVNNHKVPKIESHHTPSNHCCGCCSHNRMPMPMPQPVTNTVHYIYAPVPTFYPAMSPYQIYENYCDRHTRVNKSPVADYIYNHHQPVTPRITPRQSFSKAPINTQHQYNYDYHQNSDYVYQNQLQIAAQSHNQLPPVHNHYQDIRSPVADYIHLNQPIVSLHKLNDKKAISLPDINKQPMAMKYNEPPCKECNECKYCKFYENLRAQKSISQQNKTLKQPQKPPLVSTNAKLKSLEATATKNSLKIPLGDGSEDHEPTSIIINVI